MMDSNYDLHTTGGAEMNRISYSKRKVVRHCMAVLLSVVLTAGTCLPAIAVDQQPNDQEEMGGEEVTTAEQDPQRWLKIILMVVLVLLVLGLILYFLKNKPDAAKALIEDRARLFAGRV